MDIDFYRAETGLQCSYSPESCTVKMHHHPLGRVEDKSMSKFNALQGPAQLRAEVGRASVRSVNMEPHSLFCTCEKDLNTMTFHVVLSNRTDNIGSKFEDVQTGPSSDRLSKAHTPVDPKVAHS